MRLKDDGGDDEKGGLYVCVCACVCVKCIVPFKRPQRGYVL